MYLLQLSIGNTASPKLASLMTKFANQTRCGLEFQERDTNPKLANANNESRDVGKEKGIEGGRKAKWKEEKHTA